MTEVKVIYEPGCNTNGYKYHHRVATFIGRQPGMTYCVKTKVCEIKNIYNVICSLDFEAVISHYKYFKGEFCELFFLVIKTFKHLMAGSCIQSELYSSISNTVLKLTVTVNISFSLCDTHSTQEFFNLKCLRHLLPL
jgi:hypothetical protein